MSSKRSNIILIVLDTARYDEINTSQSDCLNTPFLSELSAEAMCYDSAFTQAPWTLPSHASLFTGTYPTKHGAHAGHKSLDSQLQMLPEAFSEADYETVAVSNNTWISDEFGFGRGFNTFKKTWQYVQSDVDLGKIARTKDGVDKLTTLGKKMITGNPITNITNAIYGQFFRRQQDDGAKQTNEWINEWLTNRDDSNPFFLFINYLEPHLEYRPGKEFAKEFLPTRVSYHDAMEVSQDAFGYIAGTVEMTDNDFEILRCLYQAEIAYLDYRIGELKERLEQHDEWGDTIFVVTGDHGENIGNHGLMDHQYCLYDTLLHVPLIIHGGSFNGGETSDELVQLTDLGPTLLDEVGIEAPEFRNQAQGRSFSPTTETEPRKQVIAEYMAPQPSMDALQKRVGELPQKVYMYDRSLRTIRTDEWKLIRGSDGSTELYNISVDPAEKEDVAAKNHEIKANLDTRLDQWLDSFEHANSDGEVSMRAETKERLEDLGYLQ